MDRRARSCPGRPSAGWAPSPASTLTGSSSTAPGTVLNSGLDRDRDREARAATCAGGPNRTLALPVTFGVVTPSRRRGRAGRRYRSGGGCRPPPESLTWTLLSGASSPVASRKGTARSSLDPPGADQRFWPSMGRSRRRPGRCGPCSARWVVTRSWATVRFSMAPFAAGRCRRRGPAAGASRRPRRSGRGCRPGRSGSR